MCKICWGQKLRVFFRQTHILPWSHRAGKTFVYLHDCWWKHGWKPPFPEDSHSKPLIRDQARLLRCILQAGSGHAIQHLKAEADGASGWRVRGKPMENPTFGGLEDIRKMCFCKWTLNQVTTRIWYFGLMSRLLELCRGILITLEDLQLENKVRKVKWEGK